MESTSSSARTGRGPGRHPDRDLYVDASGLLSDRRPQRGLNDRVAGALVGIVGMCMMIAAASTGVAGAVDAGTFAGNEDRAANSGGVVSGMWGDDEVYGGTSSDVLLGGAGDDFIEAAGGGHDVVRCGPGDDTVSADEGDRVLQDCETVFPSGS